MNKHKLNLIILLLLSFSVLGQVNQKDVNGKRHGKWQVNFEGTTNPKFEGNFDHGQRTGVFKFYKKGFYEHPSAIMDFGKGQDSVSVTYYTQTGKPISQGKMIDRLREGKWTYFHQMNDSVMMIEHYKNDKLNGFQETFYPDGKLAEKTHYVMGVMDGSSQIFAKNGQVLKDLHYSEGELDGKAVYYNPRGEMQMEGSYSKGSKTGIWKYYEDGKVTEQNYDSKK